MKAVIKSATFKSEFESKYGVLYSHIIEYNGKQAYYNSKKKEQTKFIAGQEAEFTEEQRQGKNGPYMVIKPIQKQGYQNKSSFNKQLVKEQARYAGFAVSYVKDLIVADKVKLEDWRSYSTVIFEHMVELDKSIE